MIKTFKGNWVSEYLESSLDFIAKIVPILNAESRNPELITLNLIPGFRNPQNAIQSPRLSCLDYLPQGNTAENGRFPKVWSRVYSHALKEGA